MTVPVLSGFAPLAERYDAAILDLWGVIHNGRSAFPGVLQCLDQMNDAGIGIVLLSNAPRRSDIVMSQLDRIGIGEERYDALVTSGDLTREALARTLQDETPAWGRTYFHLGPERDADLLEGLDYEKRDTIADADFILNTGLFDDETETGADYEVHLKPAAARNQSMICVNPDLVVRRGVREVLCAGALAAAYQGWGGPVDYFGKPDPRAYEACLSSLGEVSRGRIIAIGDSVHTDIAGANRAGIDALFVASGIHAEELGIAPGEAPDPARLETLLGEATVIGVLAALVWGG